MMKLTRSILQEIDGVDRLILPTEEQLGYPEKVLLKLVKSAKFRTQTLLNLYTHGKNHMNPSPGSSSI
jgi:hypothetical protein